MALQRSKVFHRNRIGIEAFKLMLVETELSGLKLQANVTSTRSALISRAS